MLLKANKDRHEKESNIIMSTLQRAIEKYNPGMAQRLAGELVPENKIDINKPITKEGETLLHCAAQKGQAQVVEALLNVRADARHASTHGITPLYRAAEGGHLTCVRLLLRANADMNHPAHNGETPRTITTAPSVQQEFGRIVQEQKEAQRRHRKAEKFHQQLNDQNTF